MPLLDSFQSLRIFPMVTKRSHTAWTCFAGRSTEPTAEGARFTQGGAETSPCIRLAGKPGLAESFLQSISRE
uniref:Uncharacterized protein n=1 Tax=uncultured marine virus TaxID=186617 RepID=A0A0F7KZZ4_9VIRU|nr:hypothetical protein [uncultured marine virus]